MGMVTVIAIILADLLVFLLYVYQYRQEFGLTVNGSHDLPGLRKKSASEAGTPPRAAGGAAQTGATGFCPGGEGGEGTAARVGLTGAGTMGGPWVRMWVGP